MQQAIKQIRNELSTLYPEIELQSVCRLLISKITGFSFTEILVNKNTKFCEHQQEILNNYLHKLKKGMPIQYVTGETEFCGLNLMVNESVLIPRPETEELVELVLQEVDKESFILDVGTGSGCIAVALQYFLPKAKVFACDIAVDSLSVAEHNARKHGLNICFFQTDILQETKSDKQYHVIVSNPPYIPLREKKEIMPRVKNFEPERALFVPDYDPLLFYRKIAQFAVNYLFPGGTLFFEIHRDFGKSCAEMLSDLSFRNIRIRKDIVGNDRMISAEIGDNR